ncbi:MAG TPA: hypothetical protein VGJ20_12710 [Xanthobacteraceae bacterium]|jgi:hypothetical protein
MTNKIALVLPEVVHLTIGAHPRERLPKPAPTNSEHGYNTDVAMVCASRNLAFLCWLPPAVRSKDFL